MEDRSTFMHNLINGIKIVIIIFLGVLYVTQLQALTYNIKCSESIEILNFMDKLSGWESGSAAEPYKSFWIKNNHQKKYDEKYLLLFKEIRKKYYAQNSSGLFIHNTYSQDIISTAFYDYDQINKSLLNLKANISYPDYIKFQSAIRYFTQRVNNVVTNQSHEKTIQNLKKVMNQVEIKDYIKNICDFYNVDFEKLHINIVLSYTLENVDEDAFINLDTIVLSDFTHKKNIYTNEKNGVFFQNIDNISVLMHEIVHLISSKAHIDQKKSLSKIFETHFKYTQNLSSQKKMFMIEEPLAVILGQILFTRKFSPEYYEKSQNWYANSWVNIIAKLNEKSVARYLEEKKVIDLKLVRSLARQSNELFNISESIN